MRLKLLLGVGLMLVAASMAAAAGSQLTDLTVTSQVAVTTVTFRTSGAFTHNEYRPTDNLLLVDLAGIAPARFANRAKQLTTPGVAGYHVLDYKGAGGAQVTRVELTLAPGSLVNVQEIGGGLAVKVTANGVPAMESKPAAKAEPKLAKYVEKPRKAVAVEHVGVTRGKDGPEVEIVASGAMTPKAMKLTGPDRLVIDLLNATPNGRNRQIAVNSELVKAVRMSHYQEHPPVTRVVIDLTAAADYELVPAGAKLNVKLHAAANAAPARTEAAPVVAAADAAPMMKTETPAAPPAMSTPAPAQDVVFVEAKYQPQETKPAATAAAQREDTPVKVPTMSASLKPTAAVNLAALQMQQAAPPAPTGPQSCISDRYTGEPVSLNLKDVDLKDFFRLIHEISGLNIVLDPQVRGSLTLVLEDVPWDQALVIVLKNNGLDCQREGNVLRIATVNTLRQEADAARAKAEAQALAVDKVTYTHYLSYAHASEVLLTVKKFLSARGDVVADARTNALIITDIPGVIPEVQRLLVQLDRKTQEVEIEARVVAATRSFARDIGTQLGFGWGNGLNTAVGGASSVGTSPVDVTGLVPKYITIGNSIPLFSNLPAVGPTSGISVSNATNTYRLDFILTAAETRGLLKILSRPRVVTQNNIQAVVRQGVKVPVVTAAQLGGPPTVTYVDAFLQLTVTPQITAENTIFLNVNVENTTPDFGRQVNGNPTLVTQAALTSVLVNDGGTVVIGGVIQTQNSVNVSQVPLLGSIPALGNIFKRRAVSTSTQELIFFITPKIIQT